AGTQLEVPLPEMGPNGKKKYKVNLRSQSAPIQVMLINKDSAASKPVVFCVPPTDDICAMPTPPSTPADVQRFPHSCSSYSTSNTSSFSSYTWGLIIDWCRSCIIFAVFPLVRLSPNAAVDYNFNLDDNEGVCDLFDVQILNY
uniref:E2F transcription factor 5 n=1 Tax=Myripristis murdjan TaxID=586833 RepID=A0A667XQL3_9TELE